MQNVVIVFLDRKASNSLLQSSGWKAGVDDFVALVTLGAGGATDTENLTDPFAGFVCPQNGVVDNLTLEDSKHTKLDKQLAPNLGTTPEIRKGCIKQPFEFK